MISKSIRRRGSVYEDSLQNAKPKCLRVSCALLVLACVFVSTGLAQSSEEKVLARLTSPGVGGGLILDSQGNLYGTAAGFAGSGHGTVFQLRPLKSGTWAFRLLYRFSGGADGATPQPGLVMDSAGNLYGATGEGGPTCSSGSDTETCGTVFKLTPTARGSWTKTVLYNFPGHGGAATPNTGLVADSAGNLYGGTASGGPRVWDGTVYRLVSNADGTWSEEQLYAFNSMTDYGMSPGRPLCV
jgi:hypothetical protein